MRNNHFFPEARLFVPLLLAGLALMLVTGCGRKKNLNPYEAGYFSPKIAPPETPPDFRLRPPRLGESTVPNPSSQAARQLALVQGKLRGLSPLERRLLQELDSLGAPADIREKLYAENGNVIDSSPNLSNMLVFWSNFDDPDNLDYGEAPLQVEDEQDWLRKRKEGIVALIGEEKITIAHDKTILLPGTR